VAKNSNMKILGITCGVLLLIAGIGLAVVAYLGYKQVQSIQEGIKNPEQKVMEVLGTQRLPEGYFPNMGISIPFVTDTAIISDKPNLDDKPPKLGDGLGFLYTLVKIGQEKNAVKLRAFFDGETDDPSALQENQFNMDLNADDIIHRGIMDVNGMSVRFVVSSKGIENEHVEADGLATLFLFECNDDKMRFGIWFSPQAVEKTETGEVDLTGTVGDENNIRSFLSHFDLCGIEEKN